MVVRAATLSLVVGGALLLATAFPVEAGHGASGTALSGVVCNGKERWDIKTLSDPAAGQVNLDPDEIKNRPGRGQAGTSTGQGAGAGRVRGRIDLE